MPFPLAHPAAVLPFRRWSTPYLNFVVLMIGSITPDLGYCLERYDVDRLSHSIRGCFIFSLPVGWVLVLIFHAVGEPLVGLLPAPHRQALLPACAKRKQPWFAVPLSLLIGAGTHVFWDSLTHETGWFVERSSFLQWVLLSWNGHAFPLHRLLWHASTWGGLLLLYRAYAKTLNGTADPAKVSAVEEKRRYAIWACLLLLPLPGAVLVAFLHNARRSSSLTVLPEVLRLSATLYLVVLLVLLIGLGVALKMRRRSSD